MQEESERALSTGVQELDLNKFVVMITNKSNSSNKSKKSDMQCDYCRRPGYTRAYYRRLIVQTTDRGFQPTRGYQSDRGDNHFDKGGISHHKEPYNHISK